MVHGPLWGPCKDTTEPIKTEFCSLLKIKMNQIKPNFLHYYNCSRTPTGSAKKVQPYQIKNKKADSV